MLLNQKKKKEFCTSYQINVLRSYVGSVLGAPYSYGRHPSTNTHALYKECTNIYKTNTKHIQRFYKHYRKNVQIILKLIVYKLYVLSLVILDLYTDWKKCICPKNTIALEDIKIIWANES